MHILILYIELIYYYLPYLHVSNNVFPLPIPPELSISIDVILTLSITLQPSEDRFKITEQIIRDVQQALAHRWLATNVYISKQGLLSGW